MATTGRLYATSASGWTNSGNATGASNGTEATAPEETPLVAGGFGIQAAIGDPPLSIDAVRVGIRARGASATYLFVETNSPSWNENYSLTATLADVSSTVSPKPTWAQLGALTVSLLRFTGYPAIHADSVWVEVDYTNSTPASLTPVAGAGAVVLATAPVAPVALAVVGEGVVAVDAIGVPPGTVYIDVVGEGAAVLAAVGVQPAALAASGEGRANLSANAVHTVALAVTGEGRTALSAAVVEVRVVRPPARTIAELVGSSTIRRDHVVILDGPRAGESLPIVGGELLLDETADVHATGSLELPPETWLRDYLDPLRTRVELRVVLALEGDDGTVHEWPRAIVHATDMPVQVSADGGLSLSVQVADRSDWVAKRGMEESYAGSGSLSLMSHVAALVARYAPWLPAGDLADPGYRSGTDLLVGDVGEDPWKHAVQLAWTAGQRLYIDAGGRLSSRPVLAPGVEVARWVEGEDECLVADLSTAMSDADVCNRLGVPWEELEPEDAPDGWTPKGGREWWEDTTGPLGTEGPLGVRARAYSGDASVIHSPAHARDVAMSHGLAQQGVQLPLDFVVLADPRRQVGDVIRVTRSKLGIADELARIQSLRFQLGSALMSGSMGARRLL